MPQPLRSILYVDDEESNLIVFEAAFEMEFQIHLASSAKDALVLVEQHPIAVVVADQKMPEMTGIELFQVLRHRNPHVQRVILSGYTEPDQLLEAINLGQIFQFVRKPWDRAELHSVLRRALDAHDMQLQNSVLREKLVLSERCAMLGQSAAKIAHEMGNQLGLLPLIEAIEDDYKHDARLLELAELARLTHDGLSRLINDIQGFVRMDGQQHVAKPFELADCIHELVSFLKFNGQLDLSCLHVQMSIDARVLGTPFQLQQVLINLLRNAADAVRETPNGRIELNVSQEIGYAKIVVADNGPGISADIRERIWEPFFTTKGKSGTGLGLDISKSIIEAAHGKIECRSTPGERTEFEIRLPLSQQRAQLSQN